MERFGCRKNYDHRGNVEEKVFSKKTHRINTLSILKNQTFVTQKCVKPIWAWYEKTTVQNKLAYAITGDPHLKIPMKICKLCVI